MIKTKTCNSKSGRFQDSQSFSRRVHCTHFQISAGTCAGSAPVLQLNKKVSRMENCVFPVIYRTMLYLVRTSRAEKLNHKNSLLGFERKQGKKRPFWQSGQVKILKLCNCQWNLFKRKLRRNYLKVYRLL